MFSKVPSEVKLHIMSFLNKNDLRNVLYVSKELNGLVNKINADKALEVIMKYSSSMVLKIKKRNFS